MTSSIASRRVAKRCPSMRARLSEPHRLSVGELSQQLPRRLIELRMPVALGQVLEVATAILATPIAMNDQAGLRPAAKPRNTQRVRHPLRAHVGLHRPADHLTAEQVENNRQV